MNTAYKFLKSYIPVRNALKTREDGNFLVASSRTNEIYYLNGMAKDMWSMLDGITSIEETYLDSKLVEFCINKCSE